MASVVDPLRCNTACEPVALDGFWRALAPCLGAPVSEEFATRIGADGYGYLGTGVIYGRRHQYGDAALGFTPIRGGKIPARPFLGMSTEDFNEIRAALLKKLVKQVGG